MSLASSPLSISAEGAPQPNRWRRIVRIASALTRWLSPFRASLALALGALLLQRLAAMAAPLLTKVVVDDVLGEARIELLTPVALAIFGAAVVQAVTGLLTTRALARASEALTAKLRREVHAHVLSLPVSFFDRARAGSLAHRMLHEVAEIDAFAGPFLLETAGALFSSLLALLVLAYLDPSLTLLACGLILALGFALAASFRHAFAVAGEQGRVNAELSGQVSEALSAIRVVKAFNAEPRERARFGRGVAHLHDLALHGSKVGTRISAVASLLFGAATASVVYFASSRVLSGALSLGEMVTFLACLGFLLTQLMALATMAPGVLRAASALERTLLLLDEETEGASRTSSLPTPRGEVVFEGVSFGYGDAIVLRDIGFRAEPGQVVALVGPSGAGKSSTLSLLAGFYEPTSGRILVDGVDLASASLASLREHVAFVPQEPWLFDGTIEENIHLARPSASLDEVRGACIEAGVDAFVTSLPGGYETPVGERGASLSAGQKQRIAIARALLKGAPILLLDEPTSALDTESESLLEPVLASREGRTTLIVSHRLSTIRRADPILVLDGGRIVERGTHTSLMAQKGRYFRMFAEEAELMPVQVRAS